MFVLGKVKVGDKLLVTNSYDFETTGEVVSIDHNVVKVKYGENLTGFNKITGLNVSLVEGVERPLFAIPNDFL